MERLIERLYKNQFVRALVADDSKLFRRRLTGLLKNLNIEALEAEDGKSARQGGDDQEEASAPAPAKTDEEPRGAKSDEEPKQDASVETLAAKFNIYAVAYATEEGV